MDKHFAGKVRDAAVISSLMPYLKTELADMHNVADNTAYGLIAQGKLSPEIALNLWNQKYSYQRLLRRFEKRLKVPENPGLDK